MIKQFDTDGCPIKIGNEKFTSKGQEPKTYQTPYGEVNLERHVYQSSQGGQTYCPLEVDIELSSLLLQDLPKLCINIQMAGLAKS